MAVRSLSSLLYRFLASITSPNGSQTTHTCAAWPGCVSGSQGIAPGDHLCQGQRRQKEHERSPAQALQHLITVALK